MMPSQMRDVEYLQHKGRFNFKALTDKARELMGKDLIGDCWTMSRDVFYMGVTPDALDGMLKKLRAMGLQTESDKEIEHDTGYLTDF